MQSYLSIWSNVHEIVILVSTGLYDEFDGQFSDTCHTPTLAWIIQGQVCFITVTKAQMVIKDLCHHHAVNAVMNWQINRWETDGKSVPRITWPVEV